MPGKFASFTNERKFTAEELASRVAAVLFPSTNVSGLSKGQQTGLQLGFTLDQVLDPRYIAMGEVAALRISIALAQGLSFEEALSSNGLTNWEVACVAEHGLTMAQARDPKFTMYHSWAITHELASADEAMQLTPTQAKGLFLKLPLADVKQPWFMAEHLMALEDGIPYRLISGKPISAVRALREQVSEERCRVALTDHSSSSSSSSSFRTPSDSSSSPNAAGPFRAFSLSPVLEPHSGVQAPPSSPTFSSSSTGSSSLSGPSEGEQRPALVWSKPLASCSTNTRGIDPESDEDDEALAIQMSLLTAAGKAEPNLAEAGKAEPDLAEAAQTATVNLYFSNSEKSKP